MRTLIVRTFIATTVMVPVARADFVIDGQPQAAPMPPAINASDTKPGVSHASDAIDRPETHRPAPAQFKVAYGFGEQIPLDFAVKQIVPSAVKVTYGPGADPAALVDWKGGQIWNHVLVAAVKPLGLRLVMTGMAIEIRN